MTDFMWGVIIGVAALLIGFTIGWNAAFFVVWKTNKERADELRKELYKDDRKTH